MAKILGLDLGTNSIGWAVVDDTNKSIKAGVSTFQAGVNLKKDGSNEEPLNVAKRNSRQQRRQVFYKDYRLTKMTEVLARNEMFPYLKIIENPDNEKMILAEIKEKFKLTDQQFKNFKLNKYKDSFQLNARIAKLLLLKGIEKQKLSTIDFQKNPITIEEFIEHLIAFIALDPYRLRSVALTEDITKIELGRILYQIGKRRGFKSSRKVKNKDEDGDAKFQEKKIKKNNKKKNWEEERKKIEDKYPDQVEIIEDNEESIVLKFPKKLSDFYAGIDRTKEAIGDFKTLGNYLYHKNSHEERIRKETHTERKMYVDEFNVLWDLQSERLGLNKLSGEKRKQKKELVEVSLREFIGDKRKGILFYQRPLKSQKHLVAICNFSNKNVRFRDLSNKVILDKNKEVIKKRGNSRCLVSHPLYEQFRAFQQINNLKIRRFNKWDVLTVEDREMLQTLFNSGEKISIKKVCEVLNITKNQLKGAAESDVDNWEDESNSKKKSDKKEGGSFTGNYSIFKLSNLLGSKWSNFNEIPEPKRNKIISSCIKNIGGETIKHDFDFRTKKTKEEREKIIYEEGKKLWKEKSEEDKDKLCSERVHEEIWHCFTFYEDNDLLFEKLNTDFGLDESKKDELKTINLKPGYGSFALKTIKKLLPFLEKGIKQTDAIFLGNIDDVFGKNKWGEFSNENKKKIEDKVSKLVLDKQTERLEINLLNSAIKELKIEVEKTNDKFQKLHDERLKYFLRSKLTGFIKDELEIIDSEKIEAQLQTYFEQTKKLCSIPSRPKFISEEKNTEDTVKEYLLKTWNVDKDRLERLWHPAKVEYLPVSHEELQEPKFQTLKNPIVKQALYSLRSAIKAIEKEHGKPDIVRIELARELNDKNRRIAIRKWQKRKEKENDDIKKELSAYPEIDTNNPDNILKYKLWLELQENKGCHACPYTGDSICFTDLFNNDKFQIEHIIPRSRCWSDAEINLTLCQTNFNNNVKKNFTPFEIKDVSEYNFNKKWFSEKRTNKKGKEKTYWHFQPLQGWRKKAEELSLQIDTLEDIIKTMNQGDARDLKMQNKYLLKYERDYYQGKYRRFQIENLSKDLNEDEEYIKSLITDTSYITKLAALYLKTYYGDDKVETVKGATTSMLREEWNIGDKNRSNHYHHAEDAVLIAFTNKSVYQELAQHRRKEKQKGKFIHPWGINEFKDKLADAVMNIAVYDKQRNKKIVNYKKTLHSKGNKRKIEISAVRGTMHEANPYGKLKLQDTFTFRKPFIDLSGDNWKNNLPKGLNWKPLEEKIEEKTLVNVKIEGIEKAVPFSKLQFSHIEKIEDDVIKELIENRLKEKEITINSDDSIIPKEAFTEKLFYKVNTKGKGEIKKCEILFEGEDKAMNRKIVKGKTNPLKINEIPLITDDAIKSAVINRFIEIFEDPKELYNLKKELSEEGSIKLIESIRNNTFDLDSKLPDTFFDKKIRRGLRDFGIPIKNVTFIRKYKTEPRIRKQLRNKDLTYGDIINITEPVRSIIQQRLIKIGAEKGNLAEKLPDAFYEEEIYVPVKNVRTHYNIELHEIRKGNYFRFGNTDHAIIHQDITTKKYYVETVPFYFAIKPDKYDEITRYNFFQGIGKKDADTFKIENLEQIQILRNGDYFILNKNFNEIQEAINSKKYLLLRENIYKVTMISATSFNIQFRKHYAAKSDVKEENKNVTSSESWLKFNPIKVKITPTGKIEKL